MKTPLSCRCPGALAALVLLAGAPLRADDPKKEPSPLGEGLRNPRPPFLVRADVNKSTRDYREGDEISVRVATEEDAYVYVFYQQADAKTFRMIFPNKYQPKNLVPARQAVDIPAKDDTYRWQVGAPFGTECIKVIASRTPLKSLSDPALVRERFNVVSAKQVKGVELELGPEKEKPPEWTDCLLEFHTYGRDQAPRPEGARRFGVFFGVSEYLFNAEYELAVKHSLNLEGCNRDARNLATLMREVGDLSNPVRVYTNKLATRRQMEFAITEWLPQVSRPGDTVFIFFAGHGLLIPPPEGTKPDGDAVLVAHDTVTRPIVNQLLERRRRAGKQQLAEVGDAQLAEWLTVDRRGADAVIRHTGVTDVEFAHWLQRLDGRQIVVILDCCHSGGFATGDKGAAGDRTPPFPFLRRQVVRLKDIGQLQCAVLAACKKEQVSQTRAEGDMGLMTHSLAAALSETRGPLEIKRAHQECEARMKKYFDDLVERLSDDALAEVLKNDPEAAKGDPARLKAKIKEGLARSVPHQPVLYHSCTQPVYLKP